MYGRIWEILRKEFLQLFRDPRMRIVLLGPPVVELIIFGYAVTLDIEKSRIAWLDLDKTVESRELQSRFEGSSYFQVQQMTESFDDVRDAIDREEMTAAVHILPGFGQDIRKGKHSSVQVIVDGTNSNTATIVSAYAGEIIERFGTDMRAESQPPAAPKLNVESRIWFNPNLRSRDFFIPGVLVNIITYVTLMLTAMSIVREKEMGTLEQLMVTPIRPVELVIGKLLPYAAIGMFDVCLITAAALIVFQTPFQGSFILLLFSALLFLLATLGIGLFISTVSQNQQQALIGSFFFLLPAILLSGFAFPIHSMPAPMQLITYLNPLRYFTEIVRGIFLKGSNLHHLWPSLTALAAIGCAILGLSATRFRKRID